jgi:branched-chain amino acid transport system substrate-binding protein
MQSVALAAWLAKEKPQANVYYLGPDYEMGRSTVAAFKSSAEAKGSKTGARSSRRWIQQGLHPVFRPDPLDAPAVIYTSSPVTTPCAC